MNISKRTMITMMMNSMRTLWNVMMFPQNNTAVISLARPHPQPWHLLRTLVWIAALRRLYFLLSEPSALIRAPAKRVMASTGCFGIRLPFTAIPAHRRILWSTTHLVELKQEHVVTKVHHCLMEAWPILLRRRWAESPQVLPEDRERSSTLPVLWIRQWHWR